MAKINFTKEHMLHLYDLANEMLFDNATIQTSMGQVLNIVELLHTTSINQLQNIMSALKKKIDKIEEADEWIAPDNDKLEELRRMKELINLIIGWKRHTMEIAENKRKKEDLTKKLAELKDSQKTPEDRIKEMEAELAALEEF
jgi:chromosome segregation ATPase